MNFKIRILALLLLIGVCRESKGQASLLFEAGTTYFSNDFESSYEHMNDFFAFTFNTRVMLMEKRSSAFAIEVPLSIRSKFSDDVVSRFGFHVPVLMTYSIGAAASSLHNEKRIGATIGAGWGYFYQQSKAEKHELPYKESISVSGPEVQFGVRIPLRTVTMFKVKDKEVSPSLTFRISNLFDIKDQQHNVGSISVLVGFAF
jgi:hypothetical protein